jgi:hypothetical protein
VKKAACDLEAKSLWPPCPRCGSAEYVHRAGLHVRLQFPPAQKFECTRCGKGKKFLAASERKYRPGRLKQLRERVQVQPHGPAGTSGVWRIRAELARTLNAMYSQSHVGAPDRTAIDKFVSELIESEISEFRLQRPRPVSQPILRRKQPVDPVQQVHYSRSA